MGGKNSCQGKRCREEPYGICECKSLMLCASCFEIHKEENPKVVHKFILMKEPIQCSEGADKPITWKSLILTRRIYRSPEGTTEVHEAMIKDRPGKYAVKVMYCRSETQLKKKEKESALQMNLKHPNICICRAAFLDTTHKSGYKFVIVMDFAENGDMDEEIDKRMLHKSPWPESELLSHITQLVDAFSYLQSSNLTHGDVKPKNLYLSGDGKIKIGDFGESKQSLQALVTRTYQVAGTMIYFSPLLFSAYLDIIKGKNSSGDVRHNPIKSDVFSLGLSFLHMATLTRPTELNNLDIGEEILQQKIERTINRISYSESVKNILRGMLQVKESKRFDFIRLNDFLHPTAPIKTSVEGSYKIVRKDSLVRCQDLKLISISQIQGKANVLDSSGRLITMNNNKFQSSSRAILFKDFAIVSGGLKTAKSVFRINLATCAAVKMTDMKEGRSWHSFVLFNDCFLSIAGRSNLKEPLASTEKLNLSAEDLTAVEWEFAEDLVNPRENATAVTTSSNIYIIGGSCKVDGRWALMDSIEIFGGGSWRNLPVKLPSPMSGVGGFVRDGEMIIIIGGTRDKGALSNDVFEFKLDSLVVEQNTGLSLKENDYFGSQISMEHNSKVFCMGSLVGCHIFDIGANQWEVEKFK